MAPSSDESPELAAVAAVEGAEEFPEAMYSTLLAKPSTSSVYGVEPVQNNVPDRPDIMNSWKRKSRSAADIFSVRDDHKASDIRFRNDILKPKKSIVVEPNYDYTPKKKDELKLKRGSTIKVIRRDDNGDGWWYGETMDGSGKKGYFPENHVQLAKGLAKEIQSDEIEIIRALGAGGFSVVKLAMYQGKEVAVKVPHSKFSKNEILEAVREEASIFQMLDHENIVEMYGVVLGDEPALVLEFCRDSLASICSSKKNISLSEEIIGNWGIQVARGMNYLHSLNVLHRDLKAANVLIKEKVCDCLLNSQYSADEQLVHSLESQDGVCLKCRGVALSCLTLKIADLGLSKKLQVADCRMSVVGTVPYLAPEVIRDRMCSKAMDVWSFGLVLWEVLTGSTPFEGMGPGAVQLQIGLFVKQIIPSSCPIDLKNIIESCWRDDPLERPKFGMLITELESFSNKYKAAGSQYLANSLYKVRKSMIEEMASLASEISRTAAELQKREEVLRKGEQELYLNRMIFDLQQTLSGKPPKEKPQPPKRRPHLRCEDISEPYDMKTEISLTKNMQMIKSDDKEKGTRDRDDVLGFATLPRTPKKLVVESAVEWRVPPERIPSKSTPDLLNGDFLLQNGSSRKLSPKLHRTNARKLKRNSNRPSVSDEVDEKCIELAVPQDLKIFLETNKNHQNTLDHLATPRRVANPVSPLVKGIGAGSHPRSSSATSECLSTKSAKEEGRGFFSKFLKRDSKDKRSANSRGFSPSLPRSAAMSPECRNVNKAHKKNCSENKDQSKKSTATHTPMKKKHTAFETGAKYGLTENSKTFVKAGHGERRISAAAPQSNTVYPLNVSPVSAYTPNEDSCSNNDDGKYERLSESPNLSIIENLSYIPPSEYGRTRASTSISSSLSPYGLLYPRSPSSKGCIYADHSNGNAVVADLDYGVQNMNITLDSPVEGGIDDCADKNRLTAFDSSIAILASLQQEFSNEFTDDLYVTLSSMQRNAINASPRRALNDDIQSESNVSDVWPDGKLADEGTLFKPQRPFTLEFTSPSTPAESGISTSNSSYISLPSGEHGPIDHVLPPRFDQTSQKLAPPIPPRSNIRRSADESADIR